MTASHKFIAYGLSVSIFTLMLITSTTHKVLATPTIYDIPDEAVQQLMPDGSFPQFDPKNPTKEVTLPQETKEYTLPYYQCTGNSLEGLTTEMEQPCNRIILYLAGECEDNDMWLFCSEDLSNYLKNHNLEEEPYLKQTDIYEDYKLLNRLSVEQMADMPFDEMLTKLKANQTG